MPSSKAAKKAPAFIDVPEISRRLGISRTHARRLMARGDFGALLDVSSPDSQRGSFRASAEAVDAWAANRAYDPTG